MNKIIAIFFLFIVSSSYAEISQVPDQTLLSTTIGTVNTIDSFLVSVTTDGVSVFVYDSSSKKYSFMTRELIPLFDSTVTTKLSDSVLVVNTHDEKLHFISLSMLPDVSYLGFVDLHMSFADFSLNDNSLYIADYFQGIIRYELSNYVEANFVDSSMKGILVTQLDRDDQYLYALDEYNGILRYEFNDSDFGTFVDFLFVPFRAKSFTKSDSLFYMHLIKGGLLVGDFNQPSGNNIVDSLIDLNQIENLFVSESSLIVTNAREMTLIEKSDLSNKTTYPLQNLLPNGMINPFDTTLSILLPNVDDGLSIVSFDTSLVIKNGLVSNGKFNDIIINNSVLYISEVNAPLQLFTINSSGFTTFNRNLYEPLSSTGQMQNNGDSLFLIYPDLEKLTIIVNADDPDSVLLENSILIPPAPVENMSYFGEQLYEHALLFFEYPFGYDVYTISDSGYIAFAAEWNFVADVTSLSVKDSIAVITNKKNECEVYQILPDFQRSQGPLASFGLSGTASESIFYNEILYLFEENELIVLNFNDINNIYIDTVLRIPMDVIDAVIVEDKMFTVGKSGIMKFELSGVLPSLLEMGGLPGVNIAVDSNIIAIHDNETVMLFYHEMTLTDEIQFNENPDIALLAQNYPNPFNLETVINYTLSQRSEIKITIYNIIGRKVKTLINTVQDAGNHFVKWNGTNRSGNVIASGIYLYKLETGNAVTTKKMILLK